MLAQRLTKSREQVTFEVIQVPAGETAKKKPISKIAILQSNYIPWKGYFDMIAAVDEFILYDDMQYTRRDLAKPKPDQDAARRAVVEHSGQGEGEISPDHSGNGN